ncbi:MAG TPA: FAD-binding protein [Devosiaceae bacterium]|jgi:electron transfer flavoprotein alpha subunit|nr:FAD-binding protein [Devosiaceae bacterium]
MAALVLAEHDLGQLSPATPRTVNAVAELGPVDVLVAGDDVAGIAAAAAEIAGVARILAADAHLYRDHDAKALAALLQRLAPGYTHIVASASATGRDVIPRLAAVLDLMPVTDVVAVLGPARFERPIYAGNALETVSNTQERQLLTIRASAFRPALKGNEAPIEAVEADVNAAAAARLVSAERTEGDRPDLSSAQIVVGGGVALGSAENFQLIEKLAAVLGAAVGATRAAVDAGYAPNDWQVGQTGKIIAPDLYIGIGISGALQHLAGIQGAKKIVAINSDPEAPLVKIADYVLVGDLFVLVPELIAELQRLGVSR